ncbi:MAG: sulfatase-like hydrolase/transferase [Acidimicrobiales bacterium]
MDTSAAGSGAARPSHWGRACALAGLAGLAITQPILDLMGRNPEFFVAGRYSQRQVVEFALVVALVPSVTLVLVISVVRLAHRGAGAAVEAVAFAALGAVFGNVVVRGLGADGLLVAGAAALAGAALVWRLVRWRPGHLLLQYLAVANVLFLAGFLFVSPASGLLAGDLGADAIGTVSVPVPDGPVVVIVFDELPLATLMRSDGTINGERYPAFARLAAGSTWFRNASSPHNRTERAVPALMTGTVLDDRVMPTFHSLPHNLLALMSTAMPVERYEPVTDLCPPGACAARAGQPLRQALEDSLVVYGHRTLPGPLRDELPAIDDGWGSFGDAVDGGAPDDDEAALPAGADPLDRWHGAAGSERNPATQARRLVDHGSAIGPTPALHFIHVVLPHPPWFITPWGTRLMQPMPEWIDEEGEPGAEWSALVRYQRHSLQTGAADVALGQVLDHLEADDLWDDATVVVVADHGTSTLLPDVARVATPANAEEVYRVPMFIKAAGQRDASVVDDVAMTVDLLPTLIDLLDIDTDWEMDGHSLLDGSAATEEPLVRPEVAPLFDLVARHAADFPHGWDWTALAAVGEHGSLVGAPLAGLEVGSPSPLRWSPSNPDAFAAVPDRAGEAPQLVTGTVSSAGATPPPALVLVVNGTVAGVTGGYRPVEHGWAFSALLGPFLRDGANVIEAYEVTTVQGRPRLHRVS